MRLAYGIFYTNDIEDIKAFYQEKMHFEFVFGDAKFVAFKIGDALLGIKKSEKEREIPGYQTIIIEVVGIDKLYESARKENLNIYKELSEANWGKNFAILDPDGNKVEFFQKL